jgi:hypothetical protein
MTVIELQQQLPLMELSGRSCYDAGDDGFIDASVSGRSGYGSGGSGWGSGSMSGRSGYGSGGSGFE